MSDQLVILEKINPEFKAKWVQGLRSEEFIQGQQVLKQTDTDGISRYCCLGVGCELIPEDVLTREVDSQKRTHYNGNAYTLPEAARKYIGTKEEIPFVIYEGQKRTLSSLNDDHELTFKEIADLIEFQL